MIKKIPPISSKPLTNLRPQTIEYKKIMTWGGKFRSQLERETKLGRYYTGSCDPNPLIIGSSAKVQI
jgi:hypothetical protein